MSRGENTLFMGKSKWVGVLTCLGTLLLAVAAWAAGGEEHVDTRAQLIDFGWRVANFLVLMGILYWLMWKKMKSFFAGRRENIKASLEEAEVVKADAEKKFREYDEKIKKAEEEIQGIAAMIRAQGEEEKKRIIADAGRAAEKMKEDAKARMEQELKKAKNELRLEASELAVQMAEDILKKKVTKEDHEGMVREYLDRMVKKN
ncbi:MAG: ATP synthase subunit b [Syntrophaceae bacterium PtaB.Bin038]|nr:MAG: ATP synthase subunit b [Syntrophaceae bacterium PtaB.Bin038]